MSVLKGPERGSLRSNATLKALRARFGDGDLLQPSMYLALYSEIPIAPQHKGQLLIHMWVARTYGLNERTWLRS